MILSALLLGSTLTEARFQNIKRMLPKGQKIHKQLQDYGCHCWRKNDQGKRQFGFGPDVPIIDPIDQACYDLSVCYDNALVEFGVDSNSKYKWRSENGSSGTPRELASVDCSQNKNRGKAAVCGCDDDFVQKLVVGLPLERRRTGTRNFPEGSSLLNIVDTRHWGDKRTRKFKHIEWDAQKTCVAGSAEAEERFCKSRHVERCFQSCAGCFLIRELGGCLEEPSGCGTCDGCTFSGWDEERCLDAERCWEDHHCNNGKRDASEQGVDCGGSCSTSCAEAGDMTPFCELIRDDGACGEDCMYAFTEPKFLQADPPIMPHSLVADICTTPEGKYTKLCPKQCACENQRSPVLCERGGRCKWEAGTSGFEWQGDCIEVPEVSEDVESADDCWEDEVGGDNQQCNAGVHAGTKSLAECKRACEEVASCEGIHWPNNGWNTCFITQDCSAPSTSIGSFYHVYKKLC